MHSPPQLPQTLQYVALSELSTDEVFRLRPSDEISSLAQSIAQVGQLSPVEVREKDGKLQPLTGFRRLRALRLLHRQKVLVRNHGEIADEVAATIAAADAIDNRSLELEELRELEERYASMGWSTPALQELISRAIERARERLEDLEAHFRGEPPPDRSIVDEDELESDDELEPLSAILARGEGAPRQPPAPGGEAAAPAVGEGSGEGGQELAHGVAARSAAGASDLGASAFAAGRASGGGPAADPDASAGATVGGAWGEAPRVAAGAPDGATRPAAPPEVAPLAPRLEGRFDAGGAEVAAGAQVTVDELARDLAERLAEISQDFSVLADHWGEIPEPLRAILSDQLAYQCQLGSWLGQPVGAEKRDEPLEP